MFKSTQSKLVLFIGSVLFSMPLFGLVFSDESWAKFQQDIKNASCNRPKQVVDNKGIFKIWFDIDKNKVATHPLFMPTEELTKKLNDQKTNERMATELIGNLSIADLDWAQEIPATASQIMVIANQYLMINDFSIIYQDNGNIQYPIISAQQFITNRSLLLNNQNIVNHLVEGFISQIKLGFVPPISAWLLHQPLFKETFATALIKEINELKACSSDDYQESEQSLILAKSVETFAVQLEKIVHIGLQQQDLDLLNEIMATIKNKINMYITAIKSGPYTSDSVANAKVMYKLIKIVSNNPVTNCNPCDYTDCCWHRDA